MASKTKFRRGKRKITIPLAIVAGFIPLAMNLKDGYDVKGWSGVTDRLPGVFGVPTEPGQTSGWAVMQQRGVPAIAGGFIAHYLAQKLGLNRMIAQAGIPLIRI